MNIIDLSCPSKTFILGEYAVLDKGSAILLNSQPRFQCVISQGHPPQNSSSFLFHDKSKKLSSNKDIFSNPLVEQWIKKYSLNSKTAFLEWKDPHKGLGGFGFSSAQLNILYAYGSCLKDLSTDKIHTKEVWRSYRSLDFQGCTPSGADLISQWAGGVCVFKQDSLSLESYIAIFPNLDCFILRTGERLDTYKYLKEFQMQDVTRLKKIAEKGVEAMESQKEEQFIESIIEYGQALAQKKWVAKKTSEILEQVLKIKHVKAAKGCGAMGAETVIMFFDTEHKEEIQKQLSDFQIICDKDGITYGIEFHKRSKVEGDTSY